MTQRCHSNSSEVTVTACRWEISGNDKTLSSLLFCYFKYLKLWSSCLQTIKHLPSFHSLSWLFAYYKTARLFFLSTQNFPIFTRARDTVICFLHKICLLTFAASKFSIYLPEACAKGSVLVFVMDLVETRWLNMFC